MANAGTAVFSAIARFGPAVKGAKDLQGALKGVKDGADDVSESTAKAARSGGGLGAKVWSGAKKGLKAGALATGAAVGGVFATAMAKGMGRLTAIDTAQAKLRGLGHDAKSVESIMKDALASVRGTAYGLDEAATTAAGAVAAGIKPGKELERYLAIVADTAAIAGISMADMGQTMNRVATSGVMMADDLNMLGDKGIPILAWLAEEYGVTTQAMKEMVSEGKVDAETYANVLEKNIGATSKGGRAALALGDTFQGAMKNVGAALGRVGANLLSGVFPLMTKGLNGVMGALEPVEGVAKKVGAALGDTLTKAVEAVTKAWDRAKESWESGSGILGGVKDGIKAFGDAWNDVDAQVTSSGFSGVMEGLAIIVRSVFDYVRDTAIPAIQEFARGFVEGHGAGGLVRDILTAVWNVAMTLFGYVLAVAIPALKALWEWFQENWKIVGVLAAMVLAYRGYLILLNATTKVITAVTKIWTGVQKALNLVMKMNPIGLVIAAITGLIAVAILAYKENETFRKVVDKAWAAIKGAIQAVVNWFKNTAWPWMRDTFANLRNAMGRTRDWIVEKWDQIKSGISKGWDAVKGIFDKFKDGLNKLRDRFRSVRDSITSAWRALVNAVAKPLNSVIEKINGFLANLKAGLNKIPGVDIKGNWSIPKIPVDNGGGGGPGPRAPVALATGGAVPGKSHSDHADNIHAMLTAGEHVIKRRSARRLRRDNPGLLEYLNKHGALPAGDSEIGWGDKRGRAPAGGGLGDWIGDAGRWVGNLWEKGKNWIVNMYKRLTSGFGDSWPAQAAKGALGETATALMNWIKGKAGGPLGSPLASGQVKWPYGWRIMPKWGFPDFHTGWDYPVPTGTSVRAAGPGRVYAGYDTRGGKYVGIDHPGSLSTGYLHLSRILAAVGSYVTKGQRIALSGNTGTATTGPHLHFQVGRGSSFWNHIDPATVMGKALGNPMRTGGWVPGQGRGDKTRVLAEPREFMVNRSAAAKWGPLLQAINEGLVGTGGDLDLIGALSERYGREVGLSREMAGLTAGFPSAAGVVLVTGDVNVNAPHIEVTVNNPVAEKSYDSIQRNLSRQARFGLIGARK